MSSIFDKRTFETFVTLALILSPVVWLPFIGLHGIIPYFVLVLALDSALERRRTPYH